MVSLFDGGVKMLVALPSLYLGPLAQSLSLGLYRTVSFALVLYDSVSFAQSLSPVPPPRSTAIYKCREHIPLRKSTNTALQMAKFSREDVLPNNKRDSDALGTECAIEFPMCNPAPSPQCLAGAMRTTKGAIFRLTSTAQSCGSYTQRP